MYECNTQEQLTRFYHTTMLHPVCSTVIKAAKAGYLRGWPGFTEKAIKQHVNPQEETENGHMKQK
eukprot:3855438-Ditylum_brightwellii.AAC.1